MSAFLRLRSAPLARSFLSRRFGAHAAPATPAASGEVSQAEKTATLLANLGGQGGKFDAKYIAYGYAAAVALSFVKRITIG